MFSVKGTDTTYEVASLDDAMNRAKLMNEFVTITGPDFELVGMFGVDSIRNGVCPDGVKYDWVKRRKVNETYN